MPDGVYMIRTPVRLVANRSQYYGTIVALSSGQAICRGAYRREPVADLRDAARDAIPS
jgi:hypothetical protein